MLHPTLREVPRRMGHPSICTMPTFAKMLRWMGTRGFVTSEPCTSHLRTVREGWGTRAVVHPHASRKCADGWRPEDLYIGALYISAFAKCFERWDTRAFFWGSNWFEMRKERER